MQVHLVAVGTHGDVLPFIAIGTELRRRGHAVALAAPAPFEASARRADLAFHPLGTQADYDGLASSPDLWHPRRGAWALFRYVSRLTEETCQWLGERWTRGGGLVVASPLGLGARVAQDLLGLPVVTVHVMPFLIESRYAPPVLPGFALPRFLPARLRHWLGRGADAYVIGPAALPELNAYRTRLGLAPVRRLRHGWNSPQRMLLMFPDWFAPRQPDWPEQAVQVPFPVADRYGDSDVLSPALSAFLDGGPAPVAFTYGSAMRHGADFFATAVALCRRTGRRGVLIAPHDAQVPRALPPEVMHVRYAPFSALLPRCAALVHHGGIGTVAQGLAAGVPQLVVPVAFDHFDEGARLKRLGLGATLTRARFTAARAARALDRLTGSPEVARACAAIRDRMSGQDGVAAACDEIERMGSERASGDRASGASAEPGPGA